MNDHTRAGEPAAEPWRGPHPLPLVDEQRLLAANADAADYYRHQLLSPAGAGPRGYLHERRLELVLNEDSIWKVGYAPPGWTRLTDHLRHLGYADHTLVEAGLAHACRRGTLIDRFRDRIVVPIHGHAGGIVAFVARAAPGAPAGCPKYLNTPTTGLYRKADTVLGLHEQRHLLATGATPVLVEGPFDVLAVNPELPGRNSDLAPVSVCGTALTTAHAAAISAAAQPGVGIVIALDDDPAGREATRRSAAALEPISGPVRQVALIGEDPASLSQRHGTDHLRRRLLQARRRAVGHGAGLDP